MLDSIGLLLVLLAIPSSQALVCPTSATGTTSALCNSDSSSLTQSECLDRGCCFFSNGCYLNVGEQCDGLNAVAATMNLFGQTDPIAPNQVHTFTLDTEGPSSIYLNPAKNWFVSYNLQSTCAQTGCSQQVQTFVVAKSAVDYYCNRVDTQYNRNDCLTALPWHAQIMNLVGESTFKMETKVTFPGPDVPVIMAVNRKPMFFEGTNITFGPAQSTTYPNLFVQALDPEPSIENCVFGRTSTVENCDYCTTTNECVKPGESCSAPEPSGDAFGCFYSDCTSCTQAEGCGWCSSSGRCLRGDSNGPAYPEGTCTSNWHASTKDCACQTPGSMHYCGDSLTDCKDNNAAGAMYCSAPVHQENVKFPTSCCSAIAPPPDSHKLSAGAVAGIVLSVGTCVVLVAVVVLLVRRKQRQHVRQQQVLVYGDQRNVQPYSQPQYNPGYNPGYQNAVPYQAYPAQPAQPGQPVVYQYTAPQN